MNDINSQQSLWRRLLQPIPKTDVGKGLAQKIIDFFHGDLEYLQVKRIFYDSPAYELKRNQTFFFKFHEKFTFWLSDSEKDGSEAYDCLSMIKELCDKYKNDRNLDENLLIGKFLTVLRLILLRLRETYKLELPENVEDNILK
jgi:hypothetical protein